MASIHPLPRVPSPAPVLLKPHAICILLAPTPQTKIFEVLQVKEEAGAKLWVSDECTVLDAVKKVRSWPASDVWIHLNPAPHTRSYTGPPPCRSLPHSTESVHLLRTTSHCFCYNRWLPTTWGRCWYTTRTRQGQAMRCHRPWTPAWASSQRGVGTHFGGDSFKHLGVSVPIHKAATDAREGVGSRSCTVWQLGGRG